MGDAENQGKDGHGETMTIEHGEKSPLVFGERAYDAFVTHA
jgi:hypothetical protein